MSREGGCSTLSTLAGSPVTTRFKVPRMGRFQALTSTVGQELYLTKELSKVLDVTRRPLSQLDGRPDSIAAPL